MSGTNNAGLFNAYPAGTAPIPAATVFLAAANTSAGASMYNYTIEQIVAYLGTTLQASTTYANDAAAAAGGVAVGGFYRNGSVVQVRVS